jgi:hypothetical protein
MSPPSSRDRDRDPTGRARNARARDQLGRPLARESRSQAAADEPALAPEAALRRGQELLDSRQPFAAHEVFEAVWKSTSGPDRELWRGLAQVAVGITHALRGNDSGAHSLLERGATTLSGFAGTTPHQVDVDGIRAWSIAASDDLGLATQPPTLVVADSKAAGAGQAASERA